MTALLAAVLLAAAPVAGKATLEVYVATAANAPGARMLRLALAGGGAEEIFFEGNPALSGAGVAWADPAVAPDGRGEVRLVLTPEASRALSELTSRSVGKRVGIVVDGRLVAAPVVLAPLRDGNLVVGGLSLAEARALAPKLGPPSPTPTAVPAPSPDLSGARVVLRLLDGTWILRSASANGIPVHDRKFTSGTWTFSAGALSATNGEGENGRFTLTVDPAAPDTFRLDAVPPSKEQAGWMLFRREGDRLRLAFFDGFKGRPDDFGPALKKVVLEFSLQGSR